jgi:hypothetical protein
MQVRLALRFLSRRVSVAESGILALGGEMVAEMMTTNAYSGNVKRPPGNGFLALRRSAASDANRSKH